MTATLPVQPTLRLPLAADVTLLSLATACAALGWHTDRGTEAVEAGEWPWVFDLSTGTRSIRELRVWRGCLMQKDTKDTKETEPPARPSFSSLPPVQLSSSAVLAEVIGTAAGDVRGAMLETRWQISAPTLLRLHRAGELTGRVAGHTLWLERASLAEFLTRRLVS